MISIPQDILLYSLIGIVIILAVIIIRLEIRINRLMKGKNAKSLEDIFIMVQKDVKGLQIFQGDIERYMAHVEKRLRRSVQNIQNIHFKAFEGLDSGGNQSFAIAFINENGDGIILSTMHARDRVNVFSKPIVNFTSKLALTEEEQAALTRAKESCKV